MGEMEGQVCAKSQGYDPNEGGPSSDEPGREEEIVSDDEGKVGGEEKGTGVG